MKESFKYWTIVALCVIGGFNVLMWGIERLEHIDALFNDTTKFKLLEERHETYAKSAYSYGRLWGEIGAQYFDDNKDEFKDNGDYRSSAKMMLYERHMDFYCWGADDCGELPTNELLMERYYVDKRTGNMPIYAFESGYIDSFVEYMELYNSN